MNVDNPKFILTLIVLSYTTICSLYIYIATLLGTIHQSLSYRSLYFQS